MLFENKLRICGKIKWIKFRFRLHLNIGIEWPFLPKLTYVIICALSWHFMWGAIWSKSVEALTLSKCLSSDIFVYGNDYTTPHCFVGGRGRVVYWKNVDRHPFNQCWSGESRGCLNYIWVQIVWWLSVKVFVIQCLIMIVVGCNTE